MDNIFLRGDLSPYRKTKSVRFHNQCSIVLIPHLTEYQTFKSCLWYTNDDYNHFRQSARSEHVMNQLFKRNNSFFTF